MTSPETRYIVLNKSSLTRQQISKLRKMLTIKNPQYERSIQAVGRAELGVPKTVEVFIETDSEIHIPRHFDDTEEFKSLGISYNGHVKHDGPDLFITWKQDAVLRPYQEKPALELVDNGNILNLVCGGGKTVIALYTTAIIGKKTAVVVDSEILATQWRERIKAFTNLYDKDIGVRGGGKDVDGKIVICMMQTLLRMPYEEFHEFYDQFPLVIFDECHTAGAIEFFKVINRFPGKRLGLTATIQRTDRLKTFIWSIGGNIVRAESEKLIPDIYMLPTDTVLNERSFTFRGKVNRAVLIRHLTNNRERNEKILDFISKKIETRNIIVLTHTRAHAQLLYDRFKNTHRCAILIGKKSGDGVKRVNHDNPQLIVATFQFLHKGFDDDRMDCIIFTTPFAAKNTLQQSVGRTLRVKEGKQKPVVYDIFDQNIQVTHSMALYRQSTYRELGYNVVRPLL